MRTFIIGKAKTVGNGGNAIYLTLKQYESARVVAAIGLSRDSLEDLMDQLGEEHQARLNRPLKSKRVLDYDGVAAVKPLSPMSAPLPSWKQPAPDYVAPPVVDTDGMTWKQIADLGPNYKIAAIKKLRATDKSFVELKEAKEHVESYMTGIGGCL